jgi:uncharacterized membrane protein
MAETKKISQDDKIWGVLSYLWILSLVALAIKKDNDFVRFHANQGALLFVISFVGLIPVLGWFINIIICILAIIGLIKAYNGEKWELPLLGKPAKEFGNWLVKTLKI